jgi:uncharacterized protein (TIGR02145 family)
MKTKQLNLNPSNGDNTMKTSIKTSRFTSLPRILGILLILGILVQTFSCSSDDSGGDGGNSPGGNSSGNSGNDIANYRTVEIGDQTWMAENLNYAAKGSKCYNNDPANCEKYGRLYDWATAKTACPSGWHLPNEDDWNALMTTVGSSERGAKLKATDGWEEDGNGTDAFGFSALPGGYGDSGSNFFRVGKGGFWWSAMEGSASVAYSRYIDYAGTVEYRYYNKKEFLSIRCIKD